MVPSNFEPRDAQALSAEYERMSNSIDGLKAFFRRAKTNGRTEVRVRVVS